ncbi:DUF6478 family protein [Paracoccus sp. (in: a-proteobacteria)]|uniref:DUF6478 family protein n=1 Tax=Paracoccus sp. TaxID=267 RepID=UPI00289A73E3|nr:DUF6478 family protein [Paracoccus sp. (in: a-proteobacteria)]
MAMRPRKWFDRVIRERAYRRWSDMAAATSGLGVVQRRNLREDAFALRRKLDLFLMHSDTHVERSRESLDALNLPIGTDWRWRPGFMSALIRPSGIASPQNGERLGEEAAVWHDCRESAMILKQVANLGVTDLSPYGLRMEIFDFSGNFLAVSIDLPPAALDGLTRSHILRLETSLSAERPMNVYARLNVLSGPNTDQVTHQVARLDGSALGQQVTEFDLAYTEINEKRLEKIWIDVIFESPFMNALEVRELFVSRHSRAEF